MARDSREDGQEVPSDDDESYSQNWIEYHEDSWLDDKNESFRQHCLYCGMKFLSIKKRLSHERFCKSGSVERFSCTECGINFQQQHSLRRHEKRHEEPGGFPCFSCSTTFTSLTSRIQHRNTEHRVFRCQICLTKCRNASDYVMHIMKSHSDCKCNTEPRKEIKLSCEKCGIKFANKNDLEVHVQEMACEKPYKCGECGKSFSFQVSLMTHSAQHSGSRPNTCEQCGETFSGYEQLIKHRRANPYTCGLPQEKKRNVVKFEGTENQKVESIEEAQIFNGNVKKEPSPETVLIENTEDFDEDLPLSELKNKVGRKKKKPEKEESSRQLRKSNRQKRSYSESSAEEFFDLSGASESQPQSPLSCYRTDSDSEYEEKEKDEQETSRVPEHKCFMCPKVYCYERKLVIHLRSEHSLDSDDDNWPLQKNGKSTKSVYKTRERRHVCQYCKRVYVNQSSLGRHIKSHGPNGELLIHCKVCKEYFATEENLKEHRETMHKEKIVCNICQKSYAGEHNLKTHIELRHTKTKTLKKMSYLCGKCGKNFTSKTALVDHERSDCGKSPIYQCDECKKFYHSAGSLKHHKTLHTKVKPFLCKYCGKPYRTPGQMKEHERVHTGERPHKCMYCPKAFSHRGSLLTHLSLHTGFKRFMCSGCGQRFTCISNLQAHRKSHADSCGLVPNCTKAVGKMESYMIPRKEEMDQE